VEQGYVLKECAPEVAGYHNNLKVGGTATVHDQASQSGTFENGGCNKMIHGNAYPNIPNMQECCNLCTNHELCDSWEYSSTKMCVLKQGAPVWEKVDDAAGLEVWSGCKAGSKNCTPPNDTTEYSADEHSPGIAHMSWPN